MVATSDYFTKNRYIGHQGRLLIGIHTMEAPEAGDTAEAVARYFSNPAVEASAHWCVDDNSRVRCVRDNDSAWTMPPTNRYSLNIEMAGYAAQNNRQWHDEYSLAVMDIAALCAAEWCVKYDIPARHLTHGEIASKAKGLAGHVDVNAVFHGSTHTDPGPNFPWDHFLEVLHAHKAIIEHKVRPPHDLNKPNCEALQRAVHAHVDNMWGVNTDRHCEAMIAATPFAGVHFPHGVEFAQGVVGTPQDGRWGPASKAALQTTIVKVQKALTEMGFEPGADDSVWHQADQDAYLAARQACHI